MERKEAYREKVQAQLIEGEAMIDVLQARGEMATAEAKIELKTAVKKLQANQHDLKKRVADIRSSGGEAWEHPKEGTEKAVAEMNSAIDRR